MRKLKLTKKISWDEPEEGIEETTVTVPLKTTIESLISDVVKQNMENHYIYFKFNGKATIINENNMDKLILDFIPENIKRDGNVDTQSIPAILGIHSYGENYEDDAYGGGRKPKRKSKKRKSKRKSKRRSKNSKKRKSKTRRRSR